MSNIEIEELPISIDTALEVIGIIQANKKGKEYQDLEKEKNIILGLIGNETERKSLFDKVYNVYCPIVRNEHN